MWSLGLLLSEKVVYSKLHQLTAGPLNFICLQMNLATTSYSNYKICTEIVKKDFIRQYLQWLASLPWFSAFHIQSYELSLSLSHTHTHTTRTYTSHTHTHTPHTYMYITHTPTRTHTHAYHTHTYTHIYTHTTHTHTHTQHTHTHTPTHPHTHPHTHTPSVWWQFDPLRVPSFHWYNCTMSQTLSLAQGHCMWAPLSPLQLMENGYFPSLFPLSPPQLGYEHLLSLWAPLPLSPAHLMGNGHLPSSLHYLHGQHHCVA